MFDKTTFLKGLKRFLFPKNLTCSFCKRENFNGKTVCDECYENLPFNDKSICEHCGRKTAYPTEYCDLCKNRQVFVDKARSVYEYKDAISKAIRKFKYDGKKFFAEEFVSEMKKVYIRSNMQADGIVFIPAERKKIRERGYNQSQVLAEKLAQKIELPVFYGVIEKVKETPSQVGLSQKERMKNLKNSFSVKDRKAVKGKSVLIVDDVMTTGSTVETVAEKLKNAGATEIYALTVASVSKPAKKDEKSASDAENVKNR